MKYKLPKIEELFEAGTHYGHQVRRWHPKMAKYIYTAKDKIHVIDLEQTSALLEKACAFIYDIASKGGQIIFVGTKRQARGIIKDSATRCGALFVNERWLGGTMTNFETIKKTIDKLITNIRRRESGELNKYTKKERLLIDREIEKLQRIVGGLTRLEGVPAAIVVIDPRKEKTVVKESIKMGVPVVALIDTNADPTGIDYVIPGNDDAIRSLTLLMDALAGAIEEGYKDFEKNKEKLAEERLKAKQDEIALKEAQAVEKDVEKAVEKPDEKAVKKEAQKVAKKEKPIKPVIKKTTK